MTEHAARQSTKDLFSSFHSKFGENIQLLDCEAIGHFDIAEINSRIIYEIRTFVALSCCESQTHSLICSSILEEVFSDFTISLYLHSIGLIVPARMSTRRAFELGVATLYLWDLPHEYWGWKSHDSDLSFSTMVNHLNSPAYNTYLESISEQGSTYNCPTSQTLQQIYRKLSNTVHGKTNELPALSPERFSIEKNGSLEHIKLTIDAQKKIIDLLFARFPESIGAVSKQFPRTERQS